MSEKNTHLPQGDSDLAQKRAQRLQDYLEESLNDPDPLQANVGAAASELSGIAVQLRGIVNDILSGKGDALHKLERHSSVLEAYFKCHRQAERYMQLDKRLADARLFRRKKRSW